jgi:hypothetical protein
MFCAQQSCALDAEDGPARGPAGVDAHAVDETCLYSCMPSCPLLCHVMSFSGSVASRPWASARRPSGVGSEVSLPRELSCLSGPGCYRLAWTGLGGSKGVRRDSTPDGPPLGPQEGNLLVDTIYRKDST